MIEFLSLQFLIGAGLGLIAGAFIGVGLGRRSNTANDAYDRARASWELREAQLREQIERLQNKG